MPRNTVAFNSNVPVELALAFPNGKFIDAPMGKRVMFSLDYPEQSVMFLDPGVAQKINLLELKPGERFSICKRPKNGSTPARWDVWLSPATEQARADCNPPSQETPHPTPPPVPERKAPAAAPVSMPPSSTPAWAKHLTAKTDALIDAYAACLEHADQHGNRVRPDDVRTLLTTVYIAMCKGVSRAA